MFHRGMQSTVDADAQQQSITPCPLELIESCQLENRTCYYYELEDPPTHTCGYCINGFIEIKDECYNVTEIRNESFTLLPELLAEYLPEYADPDVKPEDRAQRLQTVSRVISFWNSRVPPPSFTLGFTRETFLTLDERRKRLGILPSISYTTVDGIVGVDNEPRGNLERFEIKGSTSFNVAGVSTVAEDAGGNVDDDYYALEYSGEDATEGSGKKMRRRSLQSIPASVDWVAAGATTAVKNQGLCGSCWAVSTAAAIESASLISDQKSGDSKFSGDSLSFQQMISCDEDNNGCNGGNILYATRYAWINNDFNNGNMGGLVSYAEYPYENFFGLSTPACNLKGKSPDVYLNAPQIVTSVDDSYSFEERKELVMAAVAQQPVTTVLRSGCDLMSNYKGGILTHDSGCECCATSCIDHAVVIVGYNLDAEIPYWTLRNSWGEAYGEAGYFRVGMNNPGCGWGLFGMLAESAIPADVYTNIDDLPVREYPSWWQTAEGWEKALVVFGSIFGFCFLCCITGALWNRRKK